MTVREFFKNNKTELKEEGNFVMCVDDTYTQNFKKGKFYPVVKGSIHSGKSMMGLFSTSENMLNRSFVPIQGEPDNLTLKDKLMIKIRI